MKILNGEAILGDCNIELLSFKTESIDLIVTSPPYDNLRTYGGSLYWDFKNIARDLYRVIKQGGIVVWIVGDSTIKGSESGTSFEQALFFKGLGFNLHDTMIYRKKNYVPLTHNRYEQEFEYMFVFSKGKPNTFNPIKIPCKYAGTETWGNCTFHKTNDSGLVQVGKKKINDYKQHGNIFEYLTGRNRHGHPAPFPEQLVKDHILSWSNEGDTILDPFAGSFTTAVAAENTNRKWICIEKEQQYFDIGINRLNNLLL